MSVEFLMQSYTIFGTHTPNILRRHHIKSLLCKETNFQQPSSSKTPSESLDWIERFHCALLFVDISGFTVLSQELVLDDLKRHINAYFTLILNIVYKYGGEVIKFAGDALFVIWQTTLNEEGIFGMH